MNDNEMLVKQENKKLVESIDFFSQNLSFEQIVSYGYYFIHDMLKFESSAIYVLEGNDFVKKSQLDAEFDTQSFPNTQHMKILATKYGRVMQKELGTYFPDEFLENESVKLALPLLVKDNTVAVIFSRTEKIDMSNQEVAIFFHAINQLINKAAESAVNFEQFKTANAALDRKIFNLLFINHSTKALMSEIDIDRLYLLCIDVIRELTASSVTSFGLYDQARRKIVLKGYKDILSFDEYYCEVSLKTKKPRTSKLVYHIENDYELLEEIFENPEEFKTLKAVYVVLLVKNEVLGFVTIGKKVSDGGYTKELLEQTESLISSIYIAITNARYFETIKNQKEQIQHQLDLIQQMNSAIKNINTCDTVEELCHITLQTLALGFGIEKSMLIIDNGDYQVEATYGFKHENTGFELLPRFEQDCLDQTFFNPIAGDYSDYFPKVLLNDVGDGNCLVIVPLITNELTMNEKPKGFLVIFRTETAIKKSQIFLLETLGNSIAPTVKQIQEKELVEVKHIVNQKQLFLEKLDEALHNREVYYTDFKVYYKAVQLKPFDEFDLNQFSSLEVYYFNNVVLHIDYTEEALSHFDGALDVFDRDSFINELNDIV